MKKVKSCSICGKPHTRRKVNYCYACGRKHEVEVAEEILLKQGPYYEKWLKRWEAATGLKLKEGD